MINSKLVLGIETSCDDTSIAILEETSGEIKLLSHLKFGQEDLLKHWGGVVPEIAARNHLAKITPLLKDCFEIAKVSPEQVDLIAVTGLPGLLGPLLTGLNAAKSLALLYKKPVLGVNHLYAHLEAIHLTETVTYPYLGMLISGGHSIYFWVQDKNSFSVLGSTIDDASGEAFDKGGKILGLGYPAGHIVDALSNWGDPKKFKFPIGLQSSADARLSFSGLKTSLRVFCEKNEGILEKKPKQYEKFESGSQEFYDVCASYQQAICSALLLKMKYAIKKAQSEYKAPKKFPIVIGGGVACNSLIRSAFKEKYPETKIVASKYCTDNGAMIANYGRIHLEQATPFPECLKLDAKGRFINKKDFNK
ncbi:MAG: N6-L-threonylcarbamoyladenine synthase [Bacteriovoracaceae bacterium]